MAFCGHVQTNTDMFCSYNVSEGGHFCPFQSIVILCPMKPSNFQDSSKAALMISFIFHSAPEWCSIPHIHKFRYSEKTSNMFAYFVVNANFLIFPDVIQLIKCPCCLAYPHTYLLLHLPSDVPNRGSQVPK